MNVQIAMRIAGHSLSAHRIQLFLHTLTRRLRGLHQIDLITLYSPARNIAGVIGSQFLCRERLYRAQLGGIHAYRSGDQFIVEEMFQAP